MAHRHHHDRTPVRCRPRRPCGWASVLALLLALAACHKKHDQLVEYDVICDEMWANIDAQLQRRYNLIPNLVKVVKAQVKFEGDTLVKIAEARASATAIHLSGEDLTDPAKMEAFQQAQTRLNGSLSRLLVASERYPELRGNQAFNGLVVQLEGTENRLLRAREEYNAAVRTYNAEIRKVGGMIINDLTGRPFKPRVFFTVEAAARNAPEIDL
jgi:LemA protein